MADTVDAFNDGLRVAEITVDGKRIDLILTGPYKKVTETQGISSLPVVTESGRIISVGELADVDAHAACGPTEVGLEDLADVHAAGNAERVEHDLDRSPVGQIGHVLFGQNPRDDAFVAVPAGHLVADGDHTLGGDVDLDHLQHAAAEFVAPFHRVEVAIAVVDGRLDLVVADPDVIRTAHQRLYDMILSFGVAETTVGKEKLKRYDLG